MVGKKVVVLSCVALIAGCALSTGCACKAKRLNAKVTEAETVKAVKQDEGQLPIDQNQLARELIFSQAGKELQNTYFEYDSAVLKPEAISRLDRAADWLKANPNVKVQIEGYCDERGTDEYNLALGERRAHSARRYLISLGVNPDQIFTISYGEERPAVMGHDESAWQYNRRDEFKVSL